MRKLFFLTLILSAIFPLNLKAEDIVVFTDLEEKFIVKPSTVKIGNLRTRDELIKDRQLYLQERSQKAENCIKKGIVPEESCRRLWEGKTSSNLKTIINELKELEINVIAQSVSYRYIFEDLNGLKKAGDYIEIYCLNPLLPIDKYNSVNTYTGIIDNSPKNSEFASEILKAKVCNKYIKI